MNERTLLARLRLIRAQMRNHFYTGGLYALKDLIGDLETEIFLNKSLDSANQEQLELFPHEASDTERHTQP